MDRWDRPASCGRRPFRPGRRPGRGHGSLATSGRLVWVLVSCAAPLLFACAQGSDADSEIADDAGAGTPSLGVVDSVFPIDEEIRRFREGLPEATALSDGATSRDELVQRFLAALERADTAALRPLLLTRSEFGYLYYPHTMYTRDPYELSPALLWFQLQNVTGDSLTQLLRVIAGEPLHATGYECEEEPKVEGPNRVWSECRVTLDPPDGDPTQVRLFGSIVERDGAFKFVSYAAEL
jgi:hypothetical protein